MIKVYDIYVKTFAICIRVTVPIISIMAGLNIAYIK